jgi:Tfp pilus assembly PilM family ATPase
MIYSSLSSELSRVTGEIERSYEYVLQSYPGRHAADLILAGGGAALKNLDTCLTDRLGIPVAQADAYLGRPEACMTIERGNGRSDTAACGREPLAAYLCAAGLALPVEGEP